MRSDRFPITRTPALPGLLLLIVVLLLGSAAPRRTALAQGNPFTAGSVVVYRVGNGTTALVDSGSPVFLDEINPATGAVIQSIPLPTAASGSNNPVFAGNLPTEGLITRSADERRLILTGYAAQSGGGPLQNNSGIRRVVAQVEANGTVVSSTAPQDYASSGVPTSAASTDGFNFWMTGGDGGVRYTPANASSSTEILPSPPSLIQVALFEGQLYASTTESNARIGAIGAGAPLTGPQTLTPLPGLPTTGVPYGFFFANLSPTVGGVDTLYVAYDDQGLRKFNLVDGSWVARGTVGGDADNYRGLTATVEGTTVTLYATRDGRELVRLADSSGYNGTLSGTPALVASAPGSGAFRGVALAPRNIAAGVDLTISVSGPATAQVNTAYTYALRVRNSGSLPATGVSARFTLPPGVSFIDAAGSAGFTASQSGGVVSFSGGSLSQGAQADLLVSVAAASVGPVTVLPGAAVVDPGNQIGEGDESNNSSRETVVTAILPTGGSSEDTTPPETTITAGPPSPTAARVSSFSFSGSDEITLAENLLFQCSLDGAAFGPCESPQSYSGLSGGEHTFQVRAVDEAGNADPTPASATWVVRAPLFVPFVAR